jgi:nucleoside-diphosphate-sugar epimerase
LKVLLTGASGFVGSHILDALRARDITVTLLLRPNSSRELIAQHLPEVEVRNGSITDPASLTAALEGISHLLHCAGATKACRERDFYDINQIGTRNVVAAANARATPLKRLLHISSLAVTGPATAARPARETDPLNPLSDYGKSKLAAETEIRERCHAPYTILRPPAVYGPRDQGFFPMFKAVSRHVLPRPSAAQELSLVYVKDLAETVVDCLDRVVTEGKTYFVANREIVTGRKMAAEIAAQMRRWTVPCPLPAALLWPVCLSQEIFSRLSVRPMLLNLQKYAELRAPGWVCDPSLLERETGVRCATGLQTGIAAALRWYSQNRWL